jgi:hypothetical protein
MPPEKGMIILERLQEVTAMNAYEAVRVNLCAPDLLSLCGARESRRDQKRCRYYRKASRAEHCMYFVESINGHCDSVDAQRDSR